jgi:hypothetical protein
MQAAEYGAPLFAGEHLALRLAATLIVFIVVILLCVHVIVVAIVVVNLVVILFVVILFIEHSPLVAWHVGPLDAVCIELRRSARTGVQTEAAAR